MECMDPPLPIENTKNSPTVDDTAQEDETSLLHLSTR